MQAVCFADSEEPDEQGDMPFMVVETKNSRSLGPRRRVNEKDAFDMLAAVRGELEVSSWGVVESGLRQLGAVGCGFEPLQDGSKFSFRPASRPMGRSWGSLINMSSTLPACVHALF